MVRREREEEKSRTRNVHPLKARSSILDSLLPAGGSAHGEQRRGQAGDLQRAQAQVANSGKGAESNVRVGGVQHTTREDDASIVAIVGGRQSDAAKSCAEPCVAS